jgi:predicted lipoprotein with Yx(FWY)xxD motif
MRSWRRSTLVIVGAVVALAACGSSSKSSTSSSSSATTSPGYNAYPSTSVSSTTSVAPATATLKVAKNTKLGQLIVAASGKTVYLYMPDGTSTTSKVPAGLKGAWPAVTVSGTAAVGAALDSAKLAVETQPDGTKQVSYNGHLLYTFSGDAGPGTASGQGLGGIWFVLSPAGAKIG